MSDVGVHIRCNRSELEEAKRTILELQDKKIQIKFDTQQAVAPLRREIDKFKNEKIRLKFETENVFSNIDRKINELKGKILNVRLDPKMGTQALNTFSKGINAIAARKVELQFDLAKLKNDIYGTTADVADKLTAAFNKKWGTNVSKNAFGGLDNIDQVLNKIELLDAAMKKIQSRKIKVQMDAKSKIDEINAEIQKLTQAKKEIKLEAELERQEFDQKIAALEAEKKEIEMRAKAETAELDKKLADEQSTSRWITFKMRLQGYADVYNKIQGLTSRLGSTTISLGNALTKATSPINAVMRGAMYRVGYGAINKLYEGFGGTFERYDTMHSYATVMKELGYSAKQSNKAIEELEQSVLGLPTGLDEIVAAQKTYVSASGDMEKSTKMAIAANNAFISGGLDETRQRFAERQLQNLMAGADLTAMQWDSLRKNMPLAMQAVAKELGYAKKDSGKMVTDLKQGNLEADKFVDAFIKVGNEGVIADAAQVMKTTFTGLTANITNAAKRMGTNIIETLDDVMEKSTGRNLIQTLLGVDKKGNDMGDGIKHFIDDISKSVQTWIRANPDKILGFMDKVKSYDWKGLLSGMAEGFMEAGKFGVKMFEAFSKISASGFGKWMVKLNMIGRVLQVLGMGIKGLSSLAGGIGVLGRFASQANVISRLGGALKGLFSAKLFGDVAKGAAKAKTAASAMTGTGAAMTKALTGWDVAAKLATGVQIGAAGFAIKEVLEGVAEVSKVKIPENIGSILGQAAVAIGGLTTVATVAGRALSAGGPFAVLGAAIGGGVMAGASWSIKQVMTGIKDMAEGIRTLGDLKPLDESNISDVVGSVKDVAPYLKELYDTLRDSMKKGNYTEATSNQINKYVKNLTSAMETMTGIEDTVKKLAKLKIDDSLVTTAQGNIEKISGVYQTIQDKVSEVFGTIYSETTRQKGSRGRQAQGGGTTKSFEKVTSDDVAKYAEYTQMMGQVMTNIVTMFDQMKAFNDKVKEMTKGKTLGDGEDPYKKIKERFNQFAKFLKSISGLDENGEGAFFNQLRLAYNNIKDVKVGDIADVFDKLTVTIDNINTLQEKMQGSMFGGLSQGGANGVERANSYDQRRGANQSSDAFLERIKRLVKFVQDVGVELDNIPDVPDKSSQIENVEKAINKLKSAIKSINGEGFELKGETAVTEALSKLKVIGRKIKNFKFGDGGNITKKVAVEVQITVNSLDGYAHFVGQMNALKGQIERFKSDWEKKITVNVKAKVNTGSVTSYISSQIRSAVANAQSVYSKNISVSVTSTINETVRRNINTITSRHTGVQEAQGGLIGTHGNTLYRAGGGSIFKPKGTDTVPAMLTPGEYVVRRRAVSYFGAKFMQKINNLDIAGAMKDLSVRAGNNLAQGSTTIINHNDNRVDNRKVVQNFSGGTDERTGYMRANRYLMGLR